MQRFAMAIVLALLVAACGDPVYNAVGSGDPTPLAEPPVTTETTSASTTTMASDPPLTTTTTIPEPATADAPALYDEVVSETGWAIPAVAKPDYAADACSRNVWEPEAAYEFAELLLLDEFLGWDASLSEADLDRAIRLAWALAASTCADRFPETVLAAGPPEVRALPTCHPPWPYRLPWTDEVGEPDESTAADGASTATWRAPDSQVTTAAGRSEAFTQARAMGRPIGIVDGHDAVAVEDEASVTVAWEMGPRHCDARQLTISPAPEVEDIAGYVDGLVTIPWDAYLNDAEQRMLAAVDLLEGYGDIGGEPSHGGPDAVYAVESPSGADVWLYAVPVDRAGADMYPDLEPTVRESVADIEVAYGIAAEGDVVVAIMDVDGFRLVTSTDADVAALHAFVPVWIEAWSNAGR